MEQGVIHDPLQWKSQFQSECKIATFQAILFTIWHRDYELQIYTKMFIESNIRVNIFYQTLCQLLCAQHYKLEGGNLVTDTLPA